MRCDAVTATPKRKPHNIGTREAGKNDHRRQRVPGKEEETKKQKPECAAELRAKPATSVPPKRLTGI